MYNEPKRVATLRASLTAMMKFTLAQFHSRRQ